MTDIRAIRPHDREISATDATAGMIRETAVTDDSVWVGLVRAAPNRPSGWHHHGEYDSYLFVQSGAVRFEFGPEGRRIVEAGPGDFVHVPKGVIHREVNSAEDEGSVILVRVGSGPPVINVDGPEEA